MPHHIKKELLFPSNSAEKVIFFLPKIRLASFQTKKREEKTNRTTRFQCKNYSPLTLNESNLNK
jgi:hypothetical protein